MPRIGRLCRCRRREQSKHAVNQSGNILSIVVLIRGAGTTMVEWTRMMGKIRNLDITSAAWADMANL